MEIKTIQEFEDALAERMESVFGSCKRYKGVLRSYPDHLGVSNAAVLFEAAFEAGFDPDVPYPILHFHATLAQNIEEENVPGILAGLNDLNTVISTGAFPSFGCFCYYPPLHQIYLSYRMPVNPEALEADFANAGFYLQSLHDELDLFTDFILFISDDPQQMTIDDYMNFIDSVASLNDLENRLDEFEKVVKKFEKSHKKNTPN